jgi:hypothetical protein
LSPLQYPNLPWPTWPAEGQEELEKGIKSLEAGKKCIATNLATSYKQERECNAVVDKAISDLDSLNDPHLKELLAPYFSRYAEFFQAPT